MAIRMTKPWIVAATALERLHGHLGVFQLADANEAILYIGFAGAKSQFGLRGEVAAALERTPTAEKVRWEITTAYRTRHRELMMVHMADYDQLPSANPSIPLGRLSPA